MKTAILLHGTGGSDKDYFWFADTKKHLEASGYTVWWPLLPHTEKPELQESLLFLEKHHNELRWNEDMVIVGHSSACPLILAWLQHLKTRVKHVILVGGFYQPLDDDGYSDLMLPEHFDWDEVKGKAKEMILINSDNDPWGCTDQQARRPAIELGATLVVATGQGHMGSGTFNQPYKEFPLVKRLMGV